MHRFWYGIKIIWLNAGFYSGLFFITAVGILCVSLPLYCWQRWANRRSRGRAVRVLICYYGRAWARLLTFFVPVRLECEAGRQRRPCIFAINHQSFFDTYCFGFFADSEVVFAVRAWPFRIPFYGPYMRMAGYLNTENSTPGDLVAQAESLLHGGTSIAVFPEGTRSVNGSMQRFHAGAFRLAVETGAPITPICIDGTGIFLRRSSFVLRPASIVIRVLEPLYPQDFAKYGDEASIALRHAVKARLQQALDELQNEKTIKVTVDYPKEYV